VGNHWVEDLISGYQFHEEGLVSLGIWWRLYYVDSELSFSHVVGDAIQSVSSGQCGQIFWKPWLSVPIPFLMTRTSRKGNIPSDSISTVNLIEALELSRTLRKLCNLSRPCGQTTNVSSTYLSHSDGLYCAESRANFFFLNDPWRQTGSYSWPHCPFAGRTYH
jgi:hypothetical protein